MTAITLTALLVLAAPPADRGSAPASPLHAAVAAAPPAATPFPREDFTRLVIPFLAKHCIRCHSADDAEGGIDLTRDRRFEDLLSHRKSWQRVIRQLKAGAMPPDGEPRPDEKTQRQVIAWLERAVEYIDPNQPADPGHITLRRLNRSEYNNTIRDLFGVSLHLADEFPADDLGYGFDNIGDVLSVSPLRMEQYLQAAERLTSVVLGTAAVPIYDEFSEAVFFQYNQRPRNESDRGWELTPGTETWLEFEFPAPGEYEIRIHAWAVEKPEEKDRDTNARWLEAEAKFIPDPNARAPVEATLLCDDAVIGHLPVKPGNGTTALKQIYTLRFTTQAGVHTIRIRHRFPEDLTPEQRAAFAKQPLLAPRLGLRRVGLKGPYRWSSARLTPAHQALLHASGEPQNPAEDTARAALQTVADRAWRRPATPAELDELLQFVERQRKARRSRTEALALGVQAILISPKFLFHLENLPENRSPGLIVPVNDYALASRLSYFLWSSMPDEELFRLAGRGELSRPEVLRFQVRRMIADRRSDAFLEGFFGQWLGLRKVLDVSVDRKLFPEFSTELKEDFRRETSLFVESLVRDNHSVLELLNSDETFVNGRLAKFYGLPGIEKNADFRRVSLRGTPRQGVLTHGSVLLLTSYPNRTSPTRRGNWILETILGEEPPPPPDNVPELAETAAAQPRLSLRKQLELHRTNAVCASCHRTMDAIGFGLENFNAIGQWRETEQGQPIDPSGDLPSGERFRSPRELIQILSQREEDFVRHLTGRLLTYALGRGVEYYDRPAIEQIVHQTRDHRHRFQDILTEIVLSRPFRWTHHDSEAATP